MLEAADDAELIRVVLRGGHPARAAFGELVRRHEVWLVRYLTYVLSDASLAEDVAQEVFLQAHAALKTLTDPARFQAWLRTIATRRAYNHRRDRTTRSRYEQAPDAPSPAHATAPDADDERQAVVAALALLPHAYREILVLRYVEELTTDEVAAMLDIGLSAAKMRLSRARDAFRPLYAGVTHGK